MPSPSPVAMATMAALAARAAPATGPQPYALASDSFVNYENGELFGNAHITQVDASATTNGVSVYVVPPGNNKTIYCGAVVGPPMAGSVNIPMPISVATSTTEASFSTSTNVTLLVIIVYNGTSTCTLSQNFTISP